MTIFKMNHCILVLAVLMPPWPAGTRPVIPVQRPILSLVLDGVSPHQAIHSVVCCHVLVHCMFCFYYHMFLHTKLEVDKNLSFTMPTM